MRLKVAIILFLMLFCLKSFGQTGTITVNNSLTPQQMVENVLVNSPCATISNVSVSGGAFGGTDTSFGTFDANGSTFPFQNGLVLSTGKLSNVAGPNNSLSDDTANGWLGDTDLEQALGINNTLNATVIEFDFSSISNSFQFEYIFSSEEYYGNAPCNYSDGFAFLLKEAGTTNYQNLALIPNTNIPVQVTTVRPAIGGSNGCSAQNEQYFDAFNGTNHPTNFNGQTKVLIAKSNIVPNTTYHIKLVIADEHNYRYDSAIFLGGGSFTFETDLGENRLVDENSALCPNEELLLDASYLNAQSYQWFKDGIALTAATTATYNVVSAGVYSVEAVINPLCSTFGEVTIEYAPEIAINQTIFEFCDNYGNQDGISTVNLNSLISEIYSNLPANFTVGFYANSTSNTILNNSFTTTSSSEIIYAQITNFNGCYTRVPITLKIIPLNVQNDQTITICENENANLYVNGTYTSYSWSHDASLNTASTTVNQAGTYTVTVENSLGCTNSIIFTVIEVVTPSILNIDINQFSTNNSALISVLNTENYLFSLDNINFQSSPLFSNLTAGEYTVFVKNNLGCETVFAHFYILDYPKYFTPNGDGYNDYWNIKNLDKLPNPSFISIFDRFGKLLYKFKEDDLGWNGTLNNKIMPSTDYWFTLEFKNDKTIKGHFSLIR